MPPFPEQMLVRTGPEGEETLLTLAGSGARTKYMFTVYNVGLYVDVPGCSALEHAKGKSGNQLAKSDSFWESLVQAPFTKMFRIVLEMNVTGRQMTEGLSENLVPALEAQCSDDRAVSVILELLFSHIKNPLPKGTEVLMVCTADGHFLSINNKWEAVPSRHLSKAIQQIYLGKQPVSDKAKQAFAAGLPKLILRGCANPPPKPVTTKPPVKPEPPAAPVSSHEPAAVSRGPTIAPSALEKPSNDRPKRRLRQPPPPPPRLEIPEDASLGELTVHSPRARRELVQLELELEQLRADQLEKSLKLDRLEQLLHQKAGGSAVVPAEPSAGQMVLSTASRRPVGCFAAAVVLYNAREAILGWIKSRMGVLVVVVMVCVAFVRSRGRARPQRAALEALSPQSLEAKLQALEAAEESSK